MESSNSPSVKLATPGKRKKANDENSEDMIGDSKFVCEKCLKKFKSKPGLTYHIKICSTTNNGSSDSSSLLKNRISKTSYDNLKADWCENRTPIPSRLDFSIQIKECNFADYLANSVGNISTKLEDWILNIDCQSKLWNISNKRPILSVSEESSGSNYKIYPFSSTSCGNRDFFINANGPISSLQLIGQRLFVGLSRIGWNEGHSLLLMNESNKSLDNESLCNSASSIDIGADFPHVLGKASHNATLLQIWSIGKESLNLNYCIGLKYSGPIHKIERCPFHLVLSDNDRYDLISMVCGDGTCKIVVLPNHCPHSDDVNSPTVVDYTDIFSIELCTPDSLIISSSWNHVVDGEICCGLSNGSIVIWKDLHRVIENHLTSFSSLDISKNKILVCPDIVMIDSSDNFTEAGVVAVRNVAYNPKISSLILSIANDGALKVWTTQSPSRCLFTKALGVGWNIDACWDILGNGLYYCGADKNEVYFDTLWRENTATNFRKRIIAHMNRYSSPEALSHCLCDDQSFIASVSSDGTVRGGFTSILTRPKISNSGLQLFRIENMTVDHCDNTPHVHIQISKETNEFMNLVDLRQLSSNYWNKISAIDVVSCEEDNSEVFLVYGGALGLARFHRLSVLSFVVK